MGPGPANDAVHVRQARASCPGACASACDHRRVRVERRVARLDADVPDGRDRPPLAPAAVAVRPVVGRRHDAARAHVAEQLRAARSAARSTRVSHASAASFAGNRVASIGSAAPFTEKGDARRSPTARPSRRGQRPAVARVAAGVVPASTRPPARAHESERLPHVHGSALPRSREPLASSRLCCRRRPMRRPPPPAFFERPRARAPRRTP